ncbi:MAG: response regulator [Deltaproteobacteria bacterium]|nr:response regulator [Deltaproteobacteria bacterium]MCW5803078.1 response regulator [Deltaproteobacteria bacterium]
MRVLVVEDEAEARETLRDAFADQGWEVAVAANGAEALQELAVVTPCVVVLDLVMPVMNGTELFAVMQGDARWSALPVVITTSDPSRAPTGVLVMRKPLDLRRLLATVRHIVETPP